MTAPSPNFSKPSRELSALLVALIDGQLRPDQEQRLTVLLRTEPGALDAYVDHLAMHAMLKWRHGVNAGSSEKTRAGLEALAGGDAGQPYRSGASFPFGGSHKPGINARHAHWSFRAMGITLAYAASVILPVLLGLYAFDALPATHLSWFAGTDPSSGTLVAQVDARWGVPNESLTVGQELPDTLYLKSGVAQLSLNNGVSIILEGPAKFHLDSPTLTHLDLGKLIADVPHSAIGFTVRTPTADITDLGTTFGVTVAEDKTGEVQVLKGSVKTSLVAAGSGAANGGSASVLTENHAVAFSPAVATFRNIAPVAHVYMTSLRNRASLRLHSTGEGFRSGTDPNWQITANTADGRWTPREAMIAEHMPPGFRPSTSLASPSKRNEISAFHHYKSGELGSSQWLATASNWPDLPDGCKLTFKTTVDLTGFDPTSARVHLKIMADDDLLETRLNGRPTGVRFVRSDVNVTGVHDFALDRGFKPGKNTLEFVVLNRLDPDRVTGAVHPTPVALRVALDGTAVPTAAVVSAKGEGKK